MRRLEEVLHDLAEQDEQLPASELVTRIERRLSGESDFPVVVIDGRSEMDTHKNTRQTRRRRWSPALVAAGAALLVLLAVGLPILFFNGGESIVADQSTTTVASTTVPSTTAAPTTVPPTTAPATTVPATTVAPAVVVPFPPSDLAVLEVPLSKAVPGFTDTMVMWTMPLEGFDGGVMRWRPSEPTTELLLSLRTMNAAPLGLDASGNWFAGHGTEGTLSIHSVAGVAGESLDREPIGHDVDSVVWHSTEPGQLAWLECPNHLEGPATVFTLDASDRSADPVVVRSFDYGCRGNPWGDEPDGPVMTLGPWTNSGVWLGMIEDPSIIFEVENPKWIDWVLFDVDGTELLEAPGLVFSGQLPDGTPIWRDGFDDPSYLLSPDGQQRSAVPGLADDEALYEASWSPDGTRLALFLDKDGGHRPGELVIRTVDSVSVEIITEIANVKLDDTWGKVLTWSTDGRFLIYQSEPSTLVIYDTTDDTTTMLPLAETIAEIRVQ
ncbi:MAG: hypothetical protein U9N78_02575 [Actinomycetota bacterium]|nr:hypothetical protein [Actinomycetota bacterium]